MNAYAISAAKLAAWLSESPYHFYVRFHFPKLDVSNLTGLKLLKGQYANLVPVCGICFKDDEINKDLRKRQLEDHPDTWRLRTFDPFGGVGAFALSMQQAGCIKLTHAVEISPSAAKTME